MRQLRLLLATMLALVCTSGAWGEVTIGDLTFSDGVLTKIASGAEDVVVPESYVENGVTYSVTSVGNSFFTECSSTIRSITFPKTIESFDNSGIQGALFYSSTSLEEVIFAEGCQMEEIYQNTFSACTNLRRVVLPDGLKSIGSNAFRYCSQLTEITLGPNVTSIGTYAFGSCSSLKKITITGRNVVRKAPSSFSHIASRAQLIVPYGMQTTYTKSPDWENWLVEEADPVPGEMEVTPLPFNFGQTGGEISSWVEKWVTEYQQQGWTRILLPGNSPWNPTGVNSEDWKMIRRWMGGGIDPWDESATGYHVHYLDMKNAIFVVDDREYFANGPGASYNIGSEGIVPDMAFACCVNLDTLFLPSRTSYIGEWIFYGTRTNLVVHAPWAEPVTDLHAECFGGNDAHVSGMTLIVPKGSLEAYQAADHWRAFGTIIEEPMSADEEQVTVMCSDPTAAVQVWKNGNTNMGTVDTETGMLTFIMEKTGSLQLRVPTTHTVSKVIINGVDETANFTVTQGDGSTMYYTHPALTGISHFVFVQLDKAAEAATVSIVADMGRVQCMVGSRFEQFMTGGNINMTIADGERVTIMFFGNALNVETDKELGKLTHIYRDGVDILPEMPNAPADQFGKVYYYSLNEAVDGRHPKFVVTYEKYDVNGDGTVSVGDAVYIVDKILKK